MNAKSARIRLWILLSELWLDTEITESTLNFLARQFQELGYSEKEILQIHEEEVAPVLAPNLISVAGEWGGFDPDWLTRECSRMQTRRLGWRAGLARYFRRELVREMTADPFRRIFDLMQTPL